MTIYQEPLEEPEYDEFGLARIRAELEALAQSSENSFEDTTSLPLAAIEQRTELFQPRAMEEHHLQDLRRAIKSQGSLEPLTVKRFGNLVVLIDGHHRLEAYKLEKRKNEVPVRFFTGTLDEAILESGRANSQAKLVMSVQEKQNRAWQLILLGQHSKKQIQLSVGVSDGQLGRMRRVKNELGPEAYAQDTWAAALREHKGLERDPFSEDEIDAMLEAQAQDYADRLRREFSSKLPSNPELAARALSLHFGRKLPELARALGEYVDDPDEEYDEGFF